MSGENDHAISDGCLVVCRNNRCAGSAPVANVWQIYQAELARQCPAKHLEWLAPADIRDALDDYQSHLSTGLQSAMTTAERHSCRDVSAGVTCDNVGDLDIAWKNDLMPAVAASFVAVLRCAENSRTATTLLHLSARLPATDAKPKPMPESAEALRSFLRQSITARNGADINRRGK
ncbi:hypothetical protein WDV93_10905 [Pantoea ananatis]